MLLLYFAEQQITYMHAIHSFLPFAQHVRYYPQFQQNTGILAASNIVDCFKLDEIVSLKKFKNDSKLF